MSPSDVICEFQLVMDRAGRVTVSGPVQNKVLALGVLAEAAQAIHEFHRRAAEGPVVEEAPAGVLSRLGRQ